jgi:hypothetical protein
MAIGRLKFERIYSGGGIAQNGIGVWEERHAHDPLIRVAARLMLYLLHSFCLFLWAS